MYRSLLYTILIVVAQCQNSNGGDSEMSPCAATLCMHGQICIDVSEENAAGELTRVGKCIHQVNPCEITDDNKRDFGQCKMLIGYGRYNGKCEGLGGCFRLDNVLFPDYDTCEKKCNNDNGGHTDPSPHDPSPVGRCKEAHQKCLSQIPAQDCTNADCACNYEAARIKCYENIKDMEDCKEIISEVHRDLCCSGSVCTTALECHNYNYDCGIVAPSQQACRYVPFTVECKGTGVVYVRQPDASQCTAVTCAQDSAARFTDLDLCNKECGLLPPDHQPEQCGGFAGHPCPEGQHCVTEEGCADCFGTCQPDVNVADECYHSYKDCVSMLPMEDCVPGKEDVCECYRLAGMYKCAEEVKSGNSECGRTFHDIMRGLCCSSALCNDVPCADIKCEEPPHPTDPSELCIHTFKTCVDGTSVSSCAPDKPEECLCQVAKNHYACAEKITHSEGNCGGAYTELVQEICCSMGGSTCGVPCTNVRCPPVPIDPCNAPPLSDEQAVCDSVLGWAVVRGGSKCTAVSGCGFEGGNPYLHTEEDCNLKCAHSLCKSTFDQCMTTMPQPSCVDTQPNSCLCLTKRNMNTCAQKLKIVSGCSNAYAYLITEMCCGGPTCQGLPCTAVQCPVDLVGRDGDQGEGEQDKSADGRGHKKDDDDDEHHGEDDDDDDDDGHGSLSVGIIVVIVAAVLVVAVFVIILFICKGRRLRAANNKQQVYTTSFGATSPQNHPPYYTTPVKGLPGYDMPETAATTDTKQTAYVV